MIKQDRQFYNASLHFSLIELLNYSLGDQLQSVFCRRRASSVVRRPLTFIHFKHFETTRPTFTIFFKHL